MPARMLDPLPPMSTMFDPPPHLLHAAFTLCRTAVLAAGRLPTPVGPNPAPTTVPTTLPAVPGAGMVALNLFVLAAFVALLVGGVVAFVKTEPWRPRSVVGPVRIPPGGGAGWLWGRFFLAAAAFFGVQLAFGLYLGVRHQLHGATRPADYNAATDAMADAIGGVTLLVLMLGSQVAALGVLVVLGRVDPRRPLRWLGLRTANLGPAVKQAAVSLVVILPVVYLAGGLVQLVRWRLGLPMDEKHPMIEMMDKLGTAPVIGLTLLSASILAPLMEELLFRGHLQTALGHLFRRRARPEDFEFVGVDDAPPTPPRDPTVPPPPPVPPFLDYRSAPPAAPSPPAGSPGIAARWGAIVLTSAAFASVHPPFSIPVVFVLALCLGYVYERTGNLWTTILIHFGFNSISLTFALLSLLFGGK